MAKPLSKINKTTFLNNYNIVEISNDIKTIMKLLEGFNSEKQAVMIGIKKQHTLSTDEKFDIIIHEIRDIKTRLANVEKILTRNKIDGILERNNLH
ncbi:MAG: hypothetical protein MJ195_03010 [Mycoplasmoidaceae bacterium]|nr:hypothetical protein [Mycoplasmoidaceae bacterium]